MNDDLDVASEQAAAAIATAEAGPARVRKSKPAFLASDVPEGHCTNCETELIGPVCHVCGQVNDVYHRPVLGLFKELLEGLFALDGRVSRTLPSLIYRPGRVTRQFLQGRRACFIPPFRLYIFTSLIFFLLVSPNTTWDISESDRQVTMRGPESLASSDLQAAIDNAISEGRLEEEQAEQFNEFIDRFAANPATETESESSQESSDAPSEETPSEDQADQSNASSANSELESDSDAVFSFALGSDERRAQTIEDLRRWLVPEEYGEPAPDGTLSRPV